MSVVYYVMDGNDRILVSTMRERGKAKAVARNPRVSLGVLDEQWPLSYLLVYATVDVDPHLVPHPLDQPQPALVRAGSERPIALERAGWPDSRIARGDLAYPTPKWRRVSWNRLRVISRLTGLPGRAAGGASNATVQVNRQRDGETSSTR
jgi:hypothetical protein